MKYIENLSGEAIKESINELIELGFDLQRNSAEALLFAINDLYNIKEKENEIK